MVFRDNSQSLCSFAIQVFPCVLSLEITHKVELEAVLVSRLLLLLRRCCTLLLCLVLATIIVSWWSSIRSFTLKKMGVVTVYDDDISDVSSNGSVRRWLASDAIVLVAFDGGWRSTRRCCSVSVERS